MTEGRTASAATDPVSQPRSGLFSALVGLATLAILLQGLWAGIFLQHDGQRDDAQMWMDVHSAGAYVALVLAAAAAVVAVLRLRSRSDVLIGSAVFTLLIAVEIGIGFAVGAGTDGLTVVHIPLAMFIMGMAVWLPVRARSAN